MSSIPSPSADQLVALLHELVALPCPYPPGDSTAIAAFAAQRMRKAGCTVEVVSEALGIDNVVATLGSGSPCLAFNAHMDTVGTGDLSAWKTDPFTATEIGGRVVGLGAANAKGSMAVQMWLAEEIARRGGPVRGSVVFTFVGDEEALGPHGTAFLRGSGRVKPDMLILGGPTDNQLVTTERGVLWVKITALGKAAHAGEPSAGDNAMLRLMRVLNRLQDVLVPRLDGRTDGPLRSTMNLGLVRAGHNANVVPNRAEATIDRRLLPEERVADAFAEIEAIIAETGEPEGSVAVERLVGTNGFRGQAEGPAVSAFRTAIEGRTGTPAQMLTAMGVSDGRYFADDGIEIINFGPGGGEQGHAANEAVPIAQLVDAAVIQYAVVQHLLGIGSADGSDGR